MSDLARGQTEHWMGIARHSPLGILCDLDGTLVPFASSPEEARPDADAVSLIESVASLPGVTVAIVSGRPKDWLESFFPNASVYLVAEHGASRRGAGAWENIADLDPSPFRVGGGRNPPLLDVEGTQGARKRLGITKLPGRHIDPGQHSAFDERIAAFVENLATRSRKV